MFTLLRGFNQNILFVDRRHSNLKEIPEDILSAKNLEELLLDSNHLTTLPKGIFRLLKLQKLSLSENDIFELPPEIGCLTSLSELNLSKNELYDLPDAIKSLRSLQAADFSCNPLKRMPSSIISLQNLSSLKLNDLNLSELPSDFGRLINLKVLELRDNLLKELPSSFVSLKSLECIDLGSNIFQEMPPCLCQLHKLKELWLDGNEISFLLSDIKNLRNLTCFDISENELEFLPEDIGDLEQLTDFYASQNFLQLLPNGIGNLRELVIFKVDCNKLLSIPISMGNCSKLEELVIKKNEISSLPPSVENLSALRTLIADCNKLCGLPPEICKLKNLTLLSLRDNCLYYLPEDIGYLKNLQVLDLCGNRIQHLPNSITNLNLKALWLSENQHQPLLKLQTDFCWKTQKNIITCYMLPQQEYLEDNFLSSSSKDDQIFINPSRVGFEVGSTDELDKNIDLVRHGTPYPKDLQIKAAKFYSTRAKEVKKSDENKKHFQSSTVNVDSGVSSVASNCETHGPDEIHHILVQRTNDTCGLGLSIAGGNESTPYKENDDGIFVSKIVVSGPCDKAGLKVNDKILKVNNKSFVDISHYDAVQTLFQAGNEIKFTVLRPGYAHNELYTSDRTIGQNFNREADISTSSNSDNGQHFPFNDNGFKSSKISFKPLDASSSDFINQNAKSLAREASSANNVIHENGFKPEDTSTPLMFSRVSHECVPDVVQPAHFNQSSSCESKSLNEAPVIKISIQNPKLYISLGDELPPVTQALGKTTEVLTKSSFSERTITRLTYNSTLCNASLIEEVSVARKNGSLGLSIMGGSDQVSFPFGGGKPGIFVSKMQSNGPASRSGKIRVGDRLLKVNGVDVSKATHYEAVQLLCAPVEIMKLSIQHDPLPSGWKEISIKLSEGERLGVELGGGLGENSVNPFDNLDEGIFITKIVPNSAAFHDGRLKVGMRVIEVCNKTMLGATIEAANDALNCHDSFFTFTVCDGFDTASMNTSFSHLPESGSVTIDSVSCLDSDDDSMDGTRQLAHKVPPSLDKSVDERVLDVLHAAEHLVIPSTYNLPSFKKQRTTTIVLSKHIVHPSSADQKEDSKSVYLPCEV